MINLSRYFESNMTIILSYGIISLLLFGCQANDLFLQKPDAARFLSRFRRANHLFEEAKAGNLERECLEETCSREEVREIFEDDTKTEGLSVIRLPVQTVAPVWMLTVKFSAIALEDLMEHSVNSISMSASS
ncbi:coagulation factor X-like [Mustelus asterias]